MKKIILDVINRTAIGEVSEGDSGDVLELKSDTLPSEWDNCSIFALFTQDKQSKHIRIGNDLSVAIPPEFTDTNKAFQIGVYAVGGNMTRDVRPSVWIRVENTEFTTEDLVVTEQSIDDILALQSLSASIDVAEKDRIIAENKREEAEAKRVEAESQRQTDISTIKENLSALQEEMTQKVDKIDGMGLSQNSYTDHDADKLAGIEYGAQVNEPVDQTYNSQSRNAQSGKAVSEAISGKENISNKVTKLPSSLDATDEQYPSAKAVVDHIGERNVFFSNMLEGKVDKEEGKGLSGNDFTNLYKDKLNSLGNVQEVDCSDMQFGDEMFYFDQFSSTGIYRLTRMYDLADAESFLFVNRYVEDKLYCNQIWIDTYRGYIRTRSGYIQFDETFGDGMMVWGEWCICLTESNIDTVYTSSSDKLQTGKTVAQAVYKLKSELNPTPVTIIPETLSPNTSYNFGEVESLHTSFPTIATDGDVIYLTFMAKGVDTNIAIYFTNASDIDIEIMSNTGYEIYAKYNGSIWIVGYSEYTVTEGETI